MKKSYSVCLDEEVIKSLENEKWKTHKSVSFIINKLLIKRYKLKGGEKNAI
jgi:hypothetical protein